MFRFVNNGVARADAWVSLGTWIKDNWRSVLAFLGMTGLGGWIANAIEPVARQGWGLVALIGLIAAVLVAWSGR